MKNYFVIMVFGGILAACDAPSSTGGGAIETQTSPAVLRSHAPKLVAAGELVYRQHCARCHGENGEGAPKWRQRDAEGMYPPPPLNGSGHAWHHSRDWLAEMILYGSQPGKGKMPAWEDRLSEDEVEAVIEWFQSRWPDKVYAAWFEMQNR